MGLKSNWPTACTWLKKRRPEVQPETIPPQMTAAALPCVAAIVPWSICSWDTLRNGLFQGKMKSGSWHGSCNLQSCRCCEGPSETDLFGICKEWFSWDAGHAGVVQVLPSITMHKAIILLWVACLSIAQSAILWHVADRSSCNNKWGWQLHSLAWCDANYCNCQPHFISVMLRLNIVQVPLEHSVPETLSGTDCSKALPENIPSSKRCSSCEES